MNELITPITKNSGLILDLQTGKLKNYIINGKVITIL